MQALPVRLHPGDDLRAALDRVLATHGLQAGFVLSGIGSLSVASLRLAGADDPVCLTGDIEITSLAGSLSVDGSHLHAVMADAQGRVFGGHVSPGCIVRTTAEVLVAALPGWRFVRVHDAVTGYPELRTIAVPGATMPPSHR